MTSELVKSANGMAFVTKDVKSLKLANALIFLVASLLIYVDSAV
ncbi:hypothetical protein [Limosilactobacillus reuteri]|nr:hypothetical protein [Limosilactobacillus reuteri]